MKFQARLLTPIVYQKTQALIHARQDLRAVESELATTTAEMENLVAAKCELEGQDGWEVPGAFLDDEAYTDKERLRLLTATIDKKINFAKQTLEFLKAQRPRLEADFEALQEQYFDDLERAVRDDAAATALASKARSSRKSPVLCTE